MIFEGSKHEVENKSPQHVIFGPQLGSFGTPFGAQMTTIILHGSFPTLFRLPWNYQFPSAFYLKIRRAFLTNLCVFYEITTHIQNPRFWEYCSRSRKTTLSGGTGLSQTRLGAPGSLLGGLWGRPSGSGLPETLPGHQFDTQMGTKMEPKGTQTNLKKGRSFPSTKHFCQSCVHMELH